MIDPGKFLQLLQQNKIEFFAGVPDSLMKDLLIKVDQSSLQHYITANEGLAIGLATGFHFSTGNIPLVYLQNSGLGNIINPLTSLTDKEVYGVPMILLIGWRGQPGIKDEPQHIKMGRITPSLLDVLEIPYYVLDGDESNAGKMINEAVIKTRELSQPVALLVPASIFSALPTVVASSEHSLQREQAIQLIFDQLQDDDIVVCTTGRIGREFDDYNRKHHYRISQYFLSVGAMGHANHIAAAISIMDRNSRVIMLDGDGALLMHLGSLPSIAQWSDNNFIHILLNNESHESVGGQATIAKELNMTELANVAGYGSSQRISTAAGLRDLFYGVGRSQGPVFVEIMVGGQSRNDLSRPAITPAEAKQNLMRQLLKDKKGNDATGI